MNPENLIRFLQGNGQINLQKAVEIAAHFSPRTLSKNEFLLQAGKVSNEYLFLDKGFIRAFAFDTEGSDVTTGFYCAGQVVFEVSSFFNRTPSQENMQAISECDGPGIW
jgi:CRP-like cAMP-binding protein